MKRKSTKFILSSALIFLIYTVAANSLAFLGMDVLVANAIGYLVATICNFYTSKFIVFDTKSNDKIVNQMISFTALVLFGFVYNSCAVYFLKIVIGLPLLVSNVIAILTWAIISFLSQKVIFSENVR